MDIKFDNAFLASCLKAVENCDEKGKFRLAGDGKSNVRLEEMPPLQNRDIDYPKQYENTDLRGALLKGLREELSGASINGSGKKLANRKIVEISAMLSGGAVDDIDAAEVKQILSDLKRVKDQALGLSNGGEFSDWEVDDDSNVKTMADIIKGEEEWQSVVRGHNEYVKPTVAQTNFLIYGKTDAIARALDIDEEEAAQLTLDRFDRSGNDGAITFCVSGGTLPEAKTLRLTSSGFLEPAADGSEAREELNRWLGENHFVYDVIEDPAASFRASDLPEVRKFVELFARVQPEIGKEGERRMAVFNMLPDALGKVHELRRQGKLPTGAITPETWWKCLGLKGKFPGGKDPTALSRAFNTAVWEKIVDDYLTAKGWNGVAGMRECLMSGGRSGTMSDGWRKNDVQGAFMMFCNTTGCTYSQKLAFLKTSGRERSGLSMFFRPRNGTAESENIPPKYDRYEGATVRSPKDGMIPAAKSDPTAWNSFSLTGEEEDFKQLGGRFTEKQVDRILQIPNAGPEWAGAFGVEFKPRLLTIDVEKSGDDMLMAVRQPAFRAVYLGKENQKYEQGTDDMVTRYVVHKDGAYEMTGVAFENVREIPMVVTNRRMGALKVHSPTVAQTELLAQGKTAALARTLGMGEDEAARLLIDRYELAEDGAVTFRVSGGPLPEPRKLQLTADGFIVDESRRNEYAELSKLLADKDFILHGIRDAALAFNAADLKAVTGFLKFFVLTKSADGIEHSVFRSALLNILPETLERVHELRLQQGRPQHGPVSFRTWWNTLGLAGEVPAERDPKKLSQAFYDAFKEKVIGDFLSARGLKDKAVVPTALHDDFYAFARATGLSYSQKLAAMRSKDLVNADTRPVFRLAPGGALKEGRAVSLANTRSAGMTIRYAPQVQGNQTTWTTRLVVGDGKDSRDTVDGLKAQGLTDRQIRQILEIHAERLCWLGGFGLSDVPSKTTVDIEKSGADMVLTLRQPALIRKVAEKQDSEDESRVSREYEMRPEDLITRYVVHEDGAYEMAESHFEKAREKADTFVLG